VPRSDRPDASAMRSVSLMDGVERASARLRRRRRYQRTDTDSSAAPTILPTTAPAIRDLSRFELDPRDVGVAVGTAGAVPSGESWRP
jgi:hypothetical protein